LRKRTPDRDLDEVGRTPPTITEYRPAFTAPAPAELARHFPHLEILQLLGQGGMGAVYQARQTKLDRLVALKILPSESGRDPAFAARFQREARALAQLSDPHIVAVHDFGDAGGLYYFLMEYVDGANLRQLMKSGPLPSAKALPLVGQICDALQYAHGQGIIHRDIKPENILVDRRGRVKIADFGLAKLLGRTTPDQPLTASMQVMGTWHYMAPEQIETPLQVDHRADIYSLGVVFYEMLTGGLPLGRFALPSQRAPIDARLDEVVMRALEREPERRYQQINEIKTAVESIASPGLLPPTAVFSAASEVLVVDEQTIRKQLRGPAHGWLTNTTNLLAMLVCCLAMLMCVENNFRTGADLTILVTSGILLGTLLSTNFIKPIPLWRPLALIVAGTIVLIALWMSSALERGLPPIVGVLLVFLGFLQLRDVLMRKYTQTDKGNKG